MRPSLTTVVLIHVLELAVSHKMADTLPLRDLMSVKLCRTDSGTDLCAILWNTSASDSVHQFAGEVRPASTADQTFARHAMRVDEGIVGSWDLSSDS